MATYGGGVKIVGKVVVGISSNPVPTPYTVPANQYMRFQAYISDGSAATLLLDGVPLAVLGGGGGTQYVNGLVAGPGAVLSVSGFGVSASITGVLFSN